jgi:hypothetical protein
VFLHAPGGQVDVRRARRAKTRRCQPVGPDARRAGLRPRGPGLTVVWLAERLQLTADRSRNKRPLNRRYQGVIRPRAGLKRTHEEERMTASMDEERASLPPSPATEHEEGGDPACWAHRVCPECGRLNQAEHPDACEACEAAFPVY